MDNLGVINETCKLANIDVMTPDNVDLADEKVWGSIKEDTTLIFQWESDSAQSYLKKFMSPETIEIAKKYNPDFSYIKWMSFGNGLIRPGCASFRDEVAEGKATPTGFKELDEFLSTTLYRITMQEDIMRFCKLFCGYSDAESDTVRRAIAKKKGTENLLQEIHDRFLSYSNNTYGVDTDKLEEIFPPIRQGILDASAYAFSWNHSDAYSCIGYISGYLRYYYPIEFLTASLNIFNDKEDKTISIAQYANKIGVKILPPKFRHSGADYTMDKDNNSIYKGLASIKYMNRTVAEELYALRDKQYDSFIDFLNDFTGDSRQLEILIKIGFFDEFGKSQKLLNVVTLYDKYNGKKIIRKTDDTLINEMAAKFTEKETESQYKMSESGIRAFLDALCEMLPDVDIPLVNKINCEVENVGYVQTRIDGVSETAIITEIDCKYSPKIMMYDLSNGEKIVAKISKKTYQYMPVCAGDIIKYRCEDKPRMFKDSDGNWCEDATRKDKWLVFYGITTQFQ